MENNIYTAHNVFVIWEITILLLKLVLWMEGGGKIALALNGGGRTDCFGAQRRGEDRICVFMEGGGNLSRPAPRYFVVNGGGRTPRYFVVNGGGRTNPHPSSR